MEDRNNYITCRRCHARRKIEGAEAIASMRTFTARFPQIVVEERIELAIEFCDSCRRPEDHDEARVQVGQRRPETAEV